MATSEVVKYMSAKASVTMRLISSGMVKSQLRMPASIWATLVHSFLATMEQAMVEVTSPTTMTRSVGCSIKSFSKATMMPAVCSA